MKKLNQKIFFLIVFLDKKKLVKLILTVGWSHYGSPSHEYVSKCGRQIDNYCCYFFDLIGCIIGVEKSTQKGATNLTRESLRRLKEI